MKIKKILIIVILITITILGINLLNNKVLIPNKKYKDALNYRTNKDFLNAIELYEQLADYKDSYDLLEETKNEYLEYMIENKMYKEAFDYTDDLRKKYSIMQTSYNREDYDDCYSLCFNLDGDYKDTMFYFAMSKLKGADYISNNLYYDINDKLDKYIASSNDTYEQEAKDAQFDVVVNLLSLGEFHYTDGETDSTWGEMQMQQNVFADYFSTYLNGLQILNNEEIENNLSGRLFTLRTVEYTIYDEYKFENDGTLIKNNQRNSLRSKDGYDIGKWSSLDNKLITDIGNDKRIFFHELYEDKQIRETIVRKFNDKIYILEEDNGTFYILRCIDK